MSYKPSIQIIAFHGWGFSASFWDSIQDKLGDQVQFDATDRGYFSTATQAEFDRDKDLKVIFAHSGGLQWCNSNLIDQADHLVTFSGYLNFHPVDMDLYRKSKLLMRQRQAQFVDAPEKVLRDYYDLAFSPEKNNFDVPGTLNHDLLLSDLSVIDRDKHSHQRFFDLDNITILHGSEDKLVSKNKARKMFNALRYRSQYFEILKAGHAFPVTHAEKCVEIVRSIIDTRIADTIIR
jgi:pimeloyl-ACP methyl ester carboxylesterase